MLVKVAPAKLKLQILATPIGNLDELSFRAIKALKECECILCEDTRVTSKLLARLDIHNKELISYQKFNEKQKVDFAINKIVNKKTILVSDAGYPCVSDPGYALVNKCYQQGIAIEVLNGPSSIIHSAVVSGLNLNNFYFNGFLPHSGGQRKEKLNQLKNINVPIIFFESVYRIKESLKDIKDIFNDPYMVVCRELTKLNETIYRGKYDEIINEIDERGEFTIVVDKQQFKKQVYNLKDLIKKVNQMVKKGTNLKKACKVVSQSSGIQASLIYNAVVADKKVK